MDGYACCMPVIEMNRYIYVTGREEWTPDSEQMFHHLLVVKTARGNEVIFPNLWLKCSHGPRPKEL